MVNVFISIKLENDNIFITPKYQFFYVIFL